jgi:hypothetical protein
VGRSTPQRVTLLVYEGQRYRGIKGKFWDLFSGYMRGRNNGNRRSNVMKYSHRLADKVSAETLSASELTPFV